MVSQSKTNKQIPLGSTKLTATSMTAGAKSHEGARNNGGAVSNWMLERLGMLTAYEHGWDKAFVSNEEQKAASAVLVQLYENTSSNVSSEFDLGIRDHLNLVKLRELYPLTESDLQKINKNDESLTNELIANVQGEN
eukprot:m.44593 g.44593  ORF g.44593 m.44593 type:complete len:137 (+) comp10120_c0_seq1:428-838(+)